MKPILSFAIPTYNRPKQLRRLLFQLKPQLTDEIEVVILDDSDTNESALLVKDILPEARYVHGEKRGLDLANMWLLEHAKGKWVWYFSDDDEMMPNAITHVSNILFLHPDIDYMFANFTFGEKRKPAINDIPRFFRDRNELFEILGTNIGLLSSFILKREEGLKYLELGKQRSVGFAFASLVPIFGTLTGPGKFYLLGTPYVHCNPLEPEEIKKITVKNGVIQNNGFYAFGVNFYETVHLFSKSFKRSAVRKLLSINFSSVWRGLLVGWVGGWDSPKGKRLTMLRLYWSYPACWVALPIMCFPLRLNKAFYRLYKVFFNERAFKFKIKIV